MSVGEGSDAPGQSEQQPAQDQGQRQQEQRAPQRQRAPQKPQRASIGDFGRYAGQPETYTDVDGSPEDPSDPLSGLVDRSVQGQAGQELATVADEQEAVRKQSAKDARAANGKPEPEYEATLVEDDARLQSDPRYAEWQKKAEQLDAIMTGQLEHDDYLGMLIPHEFDGGRKGTISVKELKRGNLREADYHKKLRELHQLRQRYEVAEQGLHQFVGAIVSGEPNQFFTAMNIVPGAMETFKKAALVFGFQLDAENQLAPEVRQMMQEKRQLQAIAQRQQLEIQNLQRAQQQQVQQQPGPDAAFLEHQLQQFLPLAAKRLAERGTPYVDSPLAQRLGKETWDVFIQNFNGSVTLDDVVDVLASIQQQVADYIASGYVQHVPEASRQLPPVGRTAPAPSGALAQRAGAPNYAGSVNQAPRGSGASNGRPPERMRIGDIAQINRMR